MRRRGISVLAFWSMLAAPSAPAETSDAGGVVISGRIRSSSGKHPVYVMLWDADGFLRKPAQKARLDPVAEMRFQFSLAPGRWAVSAFEDMNENGTLDMGFF